MKTLLSSLVFLLLLITQDFAQQEILKKGIKDVGHFLDGNYFMIHNGEDYKLSILNADFEIVASYIRDGEGPSEARYINAVYVDQESRLVYVFRRPGIIMVFNSDLELKEEINLGRNIDATGMVIINETAYLSVNHFFQFHSNASKIVLLEYINLNNLDDKGQIGISINEISIRNRTELKNLNATRFSSKVTAHNDLIYVVLNGHPYLYKIDPNNGEIKDRIVFSQFDDVSYEVTKREPYGFGFRTHYINTSVFSFNNAVYTSHSKTDLFDAASIVMYNPKSKQTEHLTGIMSDSGSPIIKIFDGYKVHFESMEQISSYMMIYRYDP